MKVVIIGGVAGGASTATRLRRVNKDAEIIIIEKGPFISYANCGLPYHISGIIKDEEDLLLVSPQIMKDRFNINVLVNNEVISINKEDKTIEVLNIKTNEKFIESYDKLVISTGSSVIIPNIEGVDNKKVMSLWTVPDTIKIKQYIEFNNIKTVSVVGGGFIGLEMVENLRHLGLEVNLIEKQNQVLGSLDFEMAQLIHKELADNNVILYLNRGLNKIEDDNNEVRLFLDDGTVLKSELVIMSIGVKPNSKLAIDSGISTNAKGGILVNEYLETNIKDIYALGDVIEVNDYIDGSKTMIPLAGPANKQGRYLADTLNNNPKKYSGTLGTSIVKIFNKVAASTGNNEKQLMKKGMKENIDYKVVIVKGASHAKYYPMSSPIIIKAIFDNSEKILGAQIVGFVGVDKRIDIIATAIKTNLKITELMDLELAYAPPFSSAKDIVNMVGYVSENVINNLVKFIHPRQYYAIKDEVVTLDVREDFERKHSKIEGSVHIPIGMLRTRYQELDKDKTIVVYCMSAPRAYNSAIILQQMGFKDVLVQSAGMDFYLTYLFNTDSTHN
ncbi:FAD-dependent oxidoreductase [Mycoplasma sp. P36-A1]|uniref:FAD-dependent oxidoreductase n=1 Tax=Mycoplasma sp. P36-A1 TaxID=3252900 RepID=UPI003C30A561